MGTRMVSLDSEVELLPSSKFNPQSEHSRTLPCAELARKRTQHKVSLLPKGGYKPSTTNNNMPSTSLVDQDASEREVTEAENGSGEGKQSKRLEKSISTTTRTTKRGLHFRLVQFHDLFDKKHLTLVCRSCALFCYRLFIRPTLPALFN